MLFIKSFKILFLSFFCFRVLFCCSQNPIPIIYHPNYSIRFDELREFVAPGYRGMYDQWMIIDRAKTIYEYFKNKKNVKIFSPETWAQYKDLLIAHSKEYLDSFGELENIRKIIGFKFDQDNMPDVDILREKILLPARYAIAGTILGVTLALSSDCKFAINLSGGFHHAGISSGAGFCFFNDIAIGALKLLEKNKDFKILIVDLDAHLGNGTQDLLEKNKQVYIFDVHNKDRQFFSDHVSKESNIFNFPIPEKTKTEDYLEIVKKNLPELIKQIKPDFILYNAGLDVLEGDQLGGLCVSKEGLIERDSFVIKAAKMEKIPILMVLSGGYTQNSVEIIKQSIDNILKIFS